MVATPRAAGERVTGGGTTRTISVRRPVPECQGGLLTGWLTRLPPWERGHSFAALRTGSGRPRVRSGQDGRAPRRLAVRGQQPRRGVAARRPCPLLDRR